MGLTDYFYHKKVGHIKAVCFSCSCEQWGEPLRQEGVIRSVNRSHPSIKHKRNRGRRVCVVREKVYYLYRYTLLRCLNCNGEMRKSLSRQKIPYNELKSYKEKYPYEIKPKRRR